MNETYRAIRIDAFAKSFRDAGTVVPLSIAQPGAGDILVRNHYCGINAIFDTQIARDAVDYINIALPAFTGVEAIGIVEAIGPGVTDLTVGDAVVTTRFGGGYREANIGPADQFVKVPAATPEWLALASTGVSALLAIEHIGALKDGETVAVSAAAGGLGHLLVQIAIARGCHVIAICGGVKKSTFLQQLGAHRVIDYRREDVSAVLAAEYPNRIDVAIDTVSGNIFDALLTNLANHGRLVVGGAAADLDGRPEIVTSPRIAHAIYYKGASVRGFMNGLLTPLWPEARERIFAMYRDGTVKVTLDDVPFHGVEGVFDAVEHLLSGASMGKVVVALQSDPIQI